VKVKDPVGLEELREPWSELAQASRRIFSTYEWAQAWWAEYGRGRRPLVLPVVDEDHRLEGIVPLYVDVRGGVRVARLIGHGAGDELGPVCRPASNAAVASAVGAWVRAELDADIFLLESVPAVEGWHDHFRGTVLRRSANPVTVFPTADWDDFLATMSGNARSQIRSRERRLFREQDAAYRVTETRDELSADLDTFFALHRRRWGASSSLLRREAFYRRFAAAAFDRGWLNLSFLSIGGNPVAAGLDFRYAGVQSQYNSGRDPAWDRYSPGIVLRTITMRDALAAGFAEYRFLLGDESYKQRFATSDRGLVTLALGISGLGRIIVGITRASRRFGPARRIVARLTRL
jgi:CelD/BcsL family acetyltransferase involved in cellulose biosynthesis